ncbi:MAG: dimethyladenosine transferase [Eubacterium sp.]|nr:dimethyladenosine transferase [Eubacterium sp.]
MTGFNVILFNEFETLDVFGPVEIIGKLDEHFSIEYYSLEGGIVRSSQNVRIETKAVVDIAAGGILLIPGGFGTRKEVFNSEFIDVVKKLCQEARYVLTVCTGSALLAKTGLIKGLQATSNKMSFDWVCEQDMSVNWMKKARWTVDQKYYTSSGVSAGIDMTLGFVADTVSLKAAQTVANGIEYIWNQDKDNDPFCK